MNPIKATLLDDDAFRLLAIPFKGPIPDPLFEAGVDIERQAYSPTVDIKPDWFKSRVTDWHHGMDPTGVMGRQPIGKAVDLGRFDGASDEPDEDGWWVTVWMDHGRKRTQLIRRLAEQAAASKGDVGIYGSAETLPGLPLMRIPGKAEPVAWKRGVPGEIIRWPYIRQTLSTSPQNTYSVLRPMKAVLDNLEYDENAGDAMKDLLADLYALGTDLTTPSERGEAAAKAGRVLSPINERALRDALARLDEVLQSRTAERATDA